MILIILNQKDICMTKILKDFNNVSVYSIKTK